MAQSEPLLQENKDRFVIFPVKHNDIWDWYKKIESNFWTAGEIDLHQDLNDWNIKLTADERHFIKQLLTFLAASNRKINQNLTEQIVNEVQYPEAKFFYGFQIMNDNVHLETYSLLMETLGKDESEISRLFNEIKTFPAFQKKAEWFLKWKGSNSFAERLLALAAVKRIFPSSAFCSISWLKKHGLMPGFTLSQELIFRDQKIHCDFAVHLHNHHLITQVPKERIRGIILEALNIEKELINESLPAGLGMEVQWMTQYLEFVTDQLLTELNCEKEYGSSNPFETEITNLQENTSLLEKRAGEFKKAGVIYKENDINQLNYIKTP